MLTEQDAPQTPTEQDAPDAPDAIEATLAVLTAEQQAEVLHLAGLDEAGEKPAPNTPRPLPNKRDVKMAERAAHAALAEINATAARYGKQVQIDANRLQVQARAQTIGELLVAKGLCTEEELLLREFTLLTQTLHAVRADIEQQLVAQREQQEREQGPDAGRSTSSSGGTGGGIQPVRTPALVGADGRPMRITR